MIVCLEQFCLMQREIQTAVGQEKLREKIVAPSLLLQQAR